jgi:hypothetical protein
MHAFIIDRSEAKTKTKNLTNAALDDIIRQINEGSKDPYELTPTTHVYFIESGI